MRIIKQTRSKDMVPNDANKKIKRSAAEVVGNIEASDSYYNLCALSRSSIKAVNNDAANAANAGQRNLCEENIQEKEMIRNPVPNPSEVVHPQFTRPESVSRVSAVNTYYKAFVLHRVTETLLDVGGQTLLDRFISGCFGHLILWRPGNLSSQSLHGIVSREIKRPCGSEKQGMWFHINGRDICFTYSDYALVTGLRFGSSNFNIAKDHDPRDIVVYRKFCNGIQMRVSEILDRFLDLRNRIFDPDGESYLRVAHVLVAYTFLFGYDTKRHVEPWIWTLVDDLAVWNAFPWGAYTYQILQYYVKNAKDKKKYHLYGPAWALLAWGLEVIPSLGSVAGRYVSPTTHPRCLRWMFQSKINFEDITEFSEIFEQESNLPCPIVPDEDESSYIYWRSVDCQTPLGVAWAEPTNPLKHGKQFRRNQSVMRTPPPPEAIRTKRKLRQTTIDDAGPSDQCVHSSQPHHRDKGKCARFSLASSSSSSADDHYELDTLDHEFVKKVTEKIVANLKMEMVELETRLVTRLKKCFDEIVDVIHYSGSSRRLPIEHTSCPTPPILVKGCDSNIERLHTETVQEFVAKIRQTAAISLPIDPYEDHCRHDVVHQTTVCDGEDASSLLFGQAAAVNHVKLSGQQLIGRKVKIWCPQEEMSQMGKILDFNKEDRTHMVEEKDVGVGAGPPNSMSGAQNELVDVNGYRVTGSIAPTLCSIFLKYGDIARDCYSKIPRIRSVYLEEVCTVVGNLRSPKFGVTSSQLKEMVSVISEAARANLHVSWLQSFLEKINPIEEVSAKGRSSSYHLVKAAKKDVEDWKRGLMEAERRWRALECVHAKMESEEVAAEQAWKTNLDELL